MADLDTLFNRLLSFILIHRPTARWMILFYTLMDMFWPGWDGYLDDDVHEEQWEEQWREGREGDLGDEAEWDEQEWDWEDGALFSEYMIDYDPFW
ncbi:hypothetical protein BDV11DRAFT_172892 [Aspergillus similis]